MLGVGSAKLFKRLGNERAISGCGLKIFLNQSEDGISLFVFQYLTVGGPGSLVFRLTMVRE